MQRGSDSPVIILTRIIPHYREALFERLHEEFGWTVACAENPPPGTGLNLAGDDLPYVKRFPFLFPDPANQYRCQVPLREILDKTHAQVVIAEFALGMTSSFQLPLIRRSTGRPITVFWSHGFNMKIGIATKAQRARQLPRVFLAKLADAHVCYSEEGRDYLSAYIDPSRLFVAPNAFDPSLMRSLAETVTPEKAPGRPHLLAVGRITRRKDYPLLVRVTRRLAASFPDIALTIIGDGPDAGKTREAAGAELGARIRLLGAEYDEHALARHFLSADVCVFPGQVGLSVNHALAYSLPVVAFDRTPIGPPHSPEIAYVVTGVTGQRVSQYSEQALFDGLRDFLVRYPNPRESFKTTIEDFVAEKLSLDATVAGFKDLCRYIWRTARGA